MTSIFTNFITKKILRESVQNNFGLEDPYFESVPATRLNGRPSKKLKKRRKALPAGLSEHDGKVLTKVKRRAYRLDMSLCNCCGIRFGWSSIIGIIPFIGDALDAMMAMMVLRTCEQIEGGLPSHLKAMMLFNIVLDFGIGLVPFLGDIADAVFRANTRNAVLLEKHLREKGAKALKTQGHQGPLVDPSDPAEYDRLEAENLTNPPPPYQDSQSAQHVGQRQQVPGRGGPQEVPPARTKSRGWFGSGSRADSRQQPDLERGAVPH